MDERLADVIVVQDGSNPSFRAFMDYHQAEAMRKGFRPERIMLENCEKRPVPQSLVEGASCIKDILVEIEPNVAYYLN